MIIPPIITKSYITSGDGVTKSSPAISAPSVNYAKFSRFAVVKGETYIFGGTPDEKKVIAKSTKKLENENFFI